MSIESFNSESISVSIAGPQESFSSRGVFTPGITNKTKLMLVNGNPLPASSYVLAGRIVRLGVLLSDVGLEPKRKTSSPERRSTVATIAECVSRSGWRFLIL